jgi:hypothetical protein
MNEVDHGHVGGDGNTKGVAGLEFSFGIIWRKFNTNPDGGCQRRRRNRRRGIVGTTSDTERRTLRRDKLEELCFVHVFNPL